MAYTLECAAQVATQIKRLATCNAHQLAGQFANLEFWLEEAAHAVRIIDDYPRRFAQLRDAQATWVAQHGTAAIVVSCPLCDGGPCEFDGVRPPAPPRRISSSELDDARRAVKDAAYRLLLRCHRAGLLDEHGLRGACERVGTSVDLADLEAERAHRTAARTALDVGSWE